MTSDRCVAIKGLNARDDVGKSIDQGKLKFEVEVAHVEESSQSHDIQRRFFGKVYD
jgi:hypothetical protein